MRSCPAARVSTAAPATLPLGRIGDATARHDATPKVTGEFAYSSDLHAAGMLWGVTVRSPHAHARIVALDTSAALAIAGVHAVLTHADVPGRKTYGLEFADQPVLAAEVVRYYGEPVALVAAEEPEQARRAAAAVRVEYELLEPVVDMERATEQPPLHPDRPTMAHGYREDDRPNVVRHLVISHGDPEAEGQDHRLDDQEQLDVEPEAVAEALPGGRLQAVVARGAAGRHGQLDEHAERGLLAGLFDVCLITGLLSRTWTGKAVRACGTDHGRTTNAR